MGEDVSEFVETALDYWDDVGATSEPKLKFFDSIFDKYGRQFYCNII